MRTVEMCIDWLRSFFSLFELTKENEEDEDGRDGRVTYARMIQPPFWDDSHKPRYRCTDNIACLH